MKALLLSIPTKSASVGTVPDPTPGPGQLLVQVHSIALNPVDAIYTAHPIADPSHPTPRTLGSDFAGTVLSTDAPYPPGTLVAGFLQGASSSNPRPGAFAERLAVDADLVWRVPEGVYPEEAAGV